MNRKSREKRIDSASAVPILRSDVLDVRLDPGDDLLIVTPYKKFDYGLERQPDEIYKRVDHTEYCRLVTNRNWKQLTGQSIRKKETHFKVYILYNLERKLITYLKVEEILPMGWMKEDIIASIIYKRC